MESKIDNFVEFGKFPVLILLSHLHPSTDYETKFPLSGFFSGILTLLFKSPIQKMRELAAASFLSVASIFELQQILYFILKKLENSKKRLRQNFVDATLILVHFFLYIKKKLYLFKSF